MVPTASAILAENNCIRCSCTSLTFEQHRRTVLEKVADSITERPAGITNRREAADVLYWADGQIVASLEQVVEED
jgi:hypothetical protein